MTDESLKTISNTQFGLGVVEWYWNRDPNTPLDNVEFFMWKLQTVDGFDNIEIVFRGVNFDTPAFFRLEHTDNVRHAIASAVCRIDSIKSVIVKQGMYWSFSSQEQEEFVQNDIVIDKVNW